MRLFIALELDENVKNNLALSVGDMKPFATGGNFVPKDNYHVTLHFLGEVAPSDVVYVVSAMDSVKNLHAPTLAVSGVNILRASDIICARYRSGKELSELHEQLGNALEHYGFTVEHRAFRAHTTLIRKYAFSLPFSEVTKSVKIYNKPFIADKVVLYESSSVNGTLTYTPVYTLFLPKTEN